MSMVPEPEPGDFERLLWENIPQELKRRKVRDVAELESLFSRTPGTTYTAIGYLDIQPNPTKYKIIGRRENKLERRIAYQCMSCSSVLIGPPIITDDHSIDEGHPLAGREGYDVYCAHCNAHLHDITFAVS